MEGASNIIDLNKDKVKEVDSDNDWSQEQIMVKGITYNRNALKIGWNEICPCGSGKKYKKCCGKR